LQKQKIMGIKILGYLLLLIGAILLILCFDAYGRTHSSLDDSSLKMLGGIVGSILAFIGWVFIKNDEK
jgi:multisubunit Na+/H+ antiporter MnhG subunit